MADHELRQSLAGGLPEGYALQEGELGGGGFGVVYPAVFTEGSRTDDRAIKVLTDYPDASSRRSFIEEGEHLANLSAHPNIITVHERGEFFHPAAGRIRVPFIAMERAKCSFAQIPQGTEAPTIKVVNHLLGAVDGMAHVHNDAKHPDQDTLLHRDIKPGNLLLGKDGRIKITDFGIARLSDTGEQNPEQTKLIRILGTAEYMDADSFSGNPSRASDIYALGVLGYKALSGVMPITNDGPDRRWPIQHATQVVRPMPTAGHSASNARLIEHLDDVFQKAVNKDRDDRHESMTAFGEAIRDAVAKAYGEERSDTRYFIGGRLPGAGERRGTKQYTTDQELPTPTAPELPTPKPAPAPIQPKPMRRPIKPTDGPGPFPQPPSMGDISKPLGGLDSRNLDPYADEPDLSGPPFRPSGPQGFPRTESGNYRYRERFVSVERDDGSTHVRHHVRRSEGFSRRGFLGLLGVGAVAASGIYFRKEIFNFFGTPDPEKTASPEQIGTDYIGKNIVTALLSGQDEDKKQAGPILRDLARLNPDWASDKMNNSGPRWDFYHQYYRHLYIENPDLAYATLESLKKQGFDWASVAVMSSFAGGYAMIEKPTIQQEKDRLLAHDKYANMGTQVSIMIKGLETASGGADTTNWRQLLTCAMDPDNKEGNNARSLISTIDSFVMAGDLASAGALGVALAAQKPEVAAHALLKSVAYALDQDTVEAYGFVRVLADGMAPYDAARATVIEQMKRINGANKGDAARETTNHMAVSVGAFDQQAVIDYVGANMDYPDAQLTMLVVGDKGQKALQSLRDKVAAENQIWYDLAIDPTKQDVADRALDALKANPLMLRRSGGIIGAALVNGRRFADIF